MSVNDNLFVIIAASAIFYGTPLVFAAVGEVFSERAGVINLGVEGMMLLGAVFAALVVADLDGPAAIILPLAVLAAMAAAGLGALIHAFLTITLRVNQIISGLALTIFAGAAGLSSYLANIWDLGTHPASNQFGRMDLFGLKKFPVLGPILFDQTLLTYLSWALVIGAMFYLFRSRMGLHLRAVGESPQTADSVGISVTRYRYGHVIFGGMLAGVAGACFSLTIVPTWADLRRGMDRTRARHLRLLASRPHPRRGLPVRCALEPQPHPPGARNLGAVGPVERVALCRDHRGAGAGVELAHQSQARRSGGARQTLRTRREIAALRSGLAIGVAASSGTASSECDEKWRGVRQSSRESLPCGVTRAAAVDHGKSIHRSVCFQT